VPDLFVSSGSTSWNQPKKYPYTFGWQPDYFVEGKVLGEMVKRKYAGKKVAYFYQNDDFGKDGMAGLDKYIDSSQVVAREGYQPGSTDIGPQVAKIAASKADVVVLMSIPAFTALFKLATLKLKYGPQMVVSNVGSDPTTLSGLLEAYAKKGGTTIKGQTLIEGIITDGYLPSPADSSNSWTQLWTKVKAKYAPDLPLDGNVAYGMSMAYTMVQALQQAGKDLTRQKILDVVEKGDFTGPGLTPYRYSKDNHAGFSGVQVVQIKAGVPEVIDGGPKVTEAGDAEVKPYGDKPADAPSSGVPSA